MAVSIALTSPRMALTCAVTSSRKPAMSARTAFRMDSGSSARGHFKAGSGGRCLSAIGLLRNEGWSAELARRHGVGEVVVVPLQDGPSRRGDGKNNPVLPSARGEVGPRHLEAEVAARRVQSAPLVVGRQHVQHGRRRDGRTADQGGRAGGHVVDGAGNRAHVHLPDGVALVCDGGPRPVGADDAPLANDVVAGRTSRRRYRGEYVAHGKPALAAVGPGTLTLAAVKPTTITDAAVGPGTLTLAAVKPAALSVAAVGPGTLTLAAVKPVTISVAAVGPGTLTLAAVKPVTISVAAVGPGTFTPAAVTHSGPCTRVGGKAWITAAVMPSCGTDRNSDPASCRHVRTGRCTGGVTPAVGLPPWTAPGGGASCSGGGGGQPETMTRKVGGVTALPGLPP